MLPTLSRRELLGGLIGTGGAYNLPRWRGRLVVCKFTVDLVCGNIGVRAASGSHRRSHTGLGFDQLRLMPGT